MATGMTELEQYLRENAPSGEFAPCAHYDEDSDALTLYLSNEPDYRERLNSRVTVYRSMETDELVGCRIKGVRAVLEDLGWFDVAINDGKNKLSMLFVAFHGTFATDEQGRKVYRKIGEAIRSADIEVGLPQRA
jgi:hypothetical protein